MRTHIKVREFSGDDEGIVNVMEKRAPGLLFVSAYVGEWVATGQLVY